MPIICEPHLKLSWGGTIGTPAVEVFTNSLAFTGVDQFASQTFTAPTLIATIGLMAAVVKTWFSASTANEVSMISADAKLTWVKWNRIGADGLYRDNPNTLEFVGIPGSTASGPLWQQSSVISLRTGAARGRGSKGRIYPPLCGYPPSATGYMLEAVRLKMQAAAVTLIGNLNKVVPPAGWDVGQGPWNACIVSNGVRGLPPLLTPITHLYVDPIPDIQQRRVNRLPVPSVAPTSVYLNT